MLIAGNEVELMGYPQLVEMYGEENAAEMLGRSFLKRMASKTVKAVKKAAPIVATGGLSKIAPKSMQRIVKKVGMTAATGGLNLVPKKVLMTAATGGLNLVPKKVLMTAATGGLNLALKPSNIRKASSFAMKTGRAVARSPLAMAAIKSGLSIVPGGGAALSAYNAASSMVDKAKSAARKSPVASALTSQFAQKKVTSFPSAKVAPVKRTRPARPQRSAPGSSFMPQSAPAPVAAAPESPAAIPAEKTDMKLPIMIGIGGIGALALLGVMFAGKKK